ncbi:MAG: hypothetical protein ACTSVD_10695 [Candidatus Thorarchaeota archaeon]
MTYSGSYSELNCTITTDVWTYGDINNFTIGWYNRTGSADNYTDTSLSQYDNGWLNFTIKHGSVVVGEGTWNGTDNSLITFYGDISFLITIDTISFRMNASSTPYTIEFVSYNPNYDNASYTVTVVITVADTTAKGPTYGSVYWGDGFASNYSLYTDPSDRAGYNLTGLTYANYSVYDSLVFEDAHRISSGQLVHIGSGIYVFSDSVLNGSDAGTYYVVIWLHKYNYVNHTLTVKVVINMIPTQLVWSTPPADYVWGPQLSMVTLQLWDTVHGVTVSTVDSVVFEWVDESTHEVVVSESGTSLNYMFSQTIVYNGTWRIHAYVTKANYISADNLSATFVVQPQLTEIIFGSSSELTIEWGTTASFDLTYQTTVLHAPVEDATLIEANWTGEATLVDLGSGHYELRLLAVQVAVNSTVLFKLWVANHTEAPATVTVNILIPLAISSDQGASPQDPVQAYWTHNFTITVVSGDASNGSWYISGVTISYDFPAGGLTGVLTENTSGRFYWFEFPAASAPAPGVYEVTLTATRAGCMTATTSVYIEVLPTPTVAVADNQILTVYYADSYLLNFSWYTQIDGGVGVAGADQVTIELWKGAVRVNDSVGGVVDLGAGHYQFLMDTRVLGMSADSPNVPTNYYFVITMSKLGYENPHAITIIVLVMQTPVELTIESIDPIVWSDTFTVRVRLRDIIHDEYVFENAVVTFEYSGFNATFTSLGNGTFVFSYDSSHVFPASDVPLDFTVVYTLPNYIDGSGTGSIVVHPRPAHIVLIDAPESVYDWQDTFTIRLQIFINDTSTQIEADAYYYWVEFPDVNGTMAFSGTWYEATVDTALVPAGQWTLRLAAARANYTVRSVDIPIEVRALPANLQALTGDLIVAVFGVDQSARVELAYVHNDNVLPSAEVTFIWAGLERSASFADNKYVFEFNPSGDSSLDVPGLYVLNFTAKLQNYTTATAHVRLRLCAATEIQGGPFRVEAEQSFQLVFRYWDVVNDRAVGSVADAKVFYQIGNGSAIQVTEAQFNGVEYIINLAASDIGDISPDPYQIRIFASAPGYQNWTESEEPQYILVYVDPPTVEVLGYRVQRDTLMLVLLMTGGFVAIVAGAVAIRRWRIPYQIKQINRALKAIERGKRASVEGIKSMGQIIAELLAPGLAELDIATPVIEEVREEAGYEEILSEETEELLGELDALEDIGEEGAEPEAADFESELEAELAEELEEAEKAPPEEPAAEPESAVEEDEAEAVALLEETEAGAEDEGPHEDEAEAVDAETEAEETPAVEESPEGPEDASETSSVEDVEDRSDSEGDTSGERTGAPEADEDGEASDLDDEPEDVLPPLDDSEEDLGPE